MAGALEKRRLNRTLQINGLATLDDPRALLNQLSLGIKGHEEFRKLLLTVEPDKRRDCYEAFCGRLPFQPKPLEDYIIEGKKIAETRQLPEWDESTKTIRDHGALAQEAALNRAVAKAVADSEKMRTMLLHCRKCTRGGEFRAHTKKDAWKSAHEAGWRRETLNGKAEALCPQCVPETIVQ